LPSGKISKREKSNRLNFERLLMATLACVIALGVVQSRAYAGSEYPFPHPVSIEPNVKFWVAVFTTYSDRDFIIHDRDQVSRIYQVMHMPGEGDPTREEVDGANNYLKNKYADILNRLAAGQPPADAEEQRVANLFAGEPRSAFAMAAQNLRVQQGLQEQFREGLLRSRYYRPTMERIFRAAGLPLELVTLATVESGFYSRARSSAGAVGIWQFTRGTGKEYMRITRYHDDRFNPDTETRAAAELLRSNYDELGSWPLAITAYNYGTGGTAAASSEFGGDYDRIVQSYNGPHFGFAAKNYYAEFLAALEIHEHEDQYFPEIKYAEVPDPPPVRTDFAPRHIARRSHHGGIRRVVAHHAHHRQHHHTTVAAATGTGHAHGHHRMLALERKVHHGRHRAPVIADKQMTDLDS
jgi:membrane-bound lytic murein transglycosylase D